MSVPSQVVFWCFNIIGLKLLPVKAAYSSSIKDTEDITGVYSSFGVSNAIDNNPGTAFQTSDDYEINPWLQVELEKISTIYQVIIVSRKNWWISSMRNAEVRVGFTRFDDMTNGRELLVWLAVTGNENLCNTHDGPEQDGEQITINCNKPITGQLVSVQLIQSILQRSKLQTIHGFTSLSLNEIMIYGHSGKCLCF